MESDFLGFVYHTNTISSWFIRFQNFKQKTVFKNSLHQRQNCCYFWICQHSSSNLCNRQLSANIDFAILKFCYHNKSWHQNEKFASNTFECRNSKQFQNMFEKFCIIFLWKLFDVNKKRRMKKFQVTMWHQNLSVWKLKLVELHKKMVHLFSSFGLTFHIDVSTFIQKAQTWRVFNWCLANQFFWLVLLSKMPHFAMKVLNVASQFNQTKR